MGVGKHVFITRWSPKLAARFSRARIDRINRALVEIGGCYGDVDQTIVDECDRLVAETEQLASFIDEALAEGRCL